MPLAKDAKELFEVLVPAALEKYPEDARAVDAVYCFKIGGDGGGDWTVDLTADPPAVNSGDVSGAQCTVEVAHDDFKSMLSDPQAGMQLYFQGKLKVSGDPTFATKLQQFFELASRESS